MPDKLLEIIAPHYCYGCGKIGTLLCGGCKYNIVDELYSGCLLCGMPSARGICVLHSAFIDSAWVVGERSDSLERLINAFKFERVRGVHGILADLLDTVVPELPMDAIVVSIPTVRAHVRVRGYDHTALVAKEFARKRRLLYSRVLSRQTTSKQRGASRKQRFAQAEVSFTGLELCKDKTILLIDDVATTGATLHYGAKALRDAGTTTVYVAVVAKQPLDK